MLRYKVQILPRLLLQLLLDPVALWIRARLLRERGDACGAVLVFLCKASLRYWPGTTCSECLRNNVHEARCSDHIKSMLCFGWITFGSEIFLILDSMPLLSPLAHSGQCEPTSQHDTIQTKTHRIQDPSTGRLRKDTGGKWSDRTTRAACTTNETNRCRLHMSRHES